MNRSGPSGGRRPREETETEASTETEEASTEAEDYSHQDAQDLQDQDSDSDSETFFPPVRKSSSKKKRKSSTKRSKSASDDEDQPPSRNALGTAFYQNRQLQRVHNHPKMPGSSTSKRRTKAAAAAKSGTSEADQKATEKDKENAQLKETVASLEKRIKMDEDYDDAKIKGAECSAMDNLVKKTAKT